MWKAAQVVGWIVTTFVALGALYVARTSANSANRLNDAQSQQIMRLEKTTPTATITEMVPYDSSRTHTPVLTNVRRDPTLQQQIYNMYGTASNVPDNGNLFIDIHFYGERITDFNQGAPQFYLVPVRLKFGKSVVAQRWEAAGVYIGAKAPPSNVTTYRLSLYFCNSIDSKKIFTAIKKPAIKNYGFRYLSYPSCKQLDSIFVRRGT